jgi:uncharacterized linocin/CFP29 family protein
VHPKTTSVPSDTISFEQLPGELTQTLLIDEGATIRVNEIWTEFALTPQQVHETSEAHELAHTSAVTLATRAANFLAQAQDLVIFQGVNGYFTPFFQTFIRFRPGQQPTDTGLLSFPVIPQSPPLAPSTSKPLPPNQVIQVSLVGDEGRGVLYGENTFGAVSKGYSVLQQNGHYGPYVLALQTTPYADTYAPLPNTLILTADRLRPLVEAGFYGTGTLVSNSPPTEPAFTGLLVSLGGNTMDLVVGHDAMVAFLQEDADGNYRYRVLYRFALRLKDSTAVIRFEFQ